MSSSQLPVHSETLRDLPNEIVNSITHGIGLVMSVVGAMALLTFVTGRGDVWHITGCYVFATTLVAVYIASTFSHVIQQPQWKRAFRILDQALIYLLIAGSYTPWALVYFRTGLGWLLFGAMWTIALGGFISKVCFSHRIDGVSIWIYVLLGWLPVLGIGDIFRLIPLAAVIWMLVGGLCYTSGTLFLVLDKKDYHFHAIWHLFVIAGSTCHYLAVLYYVVPSAA